MDHHHHQLPVGRGRGRGLVLGSDGYPGETPVAYHTRASGFTNFISLENPRRVRQSPGQRNNPLQGGYEEDAEEDEIGGSSRSDIGLEAMSQEETEALQRENEQHRTDVEYFYKRRVILYLERAGQDGDIIKQGLSTSGLNALKKVLENIQEQHQKADDNFRLLRRSLWYTPEDTERHEHWYANVNDALLTLFDQVAERERAIGNASVCSLSSPALPPPPIASSEKYAASVIEPLKLDKFSGQPGTYRPFRSRFNLVMKKGKIDEGLQAQHLLQSLEDEPLRIATMVDLEDSEALQKMWSRLNQAFGNEQCDYQHHVTQLQNLASYPVCKSNADLKELHYTFTEHIQAIRRISQNENAGEDYKTTLCALLPDYLKRKMFKLMEERTHDYTLNKVMEIVGKQVRLSNFETVFTGKEFSRSIPTSYHREASNPWVKSRVEAEHRAKACAGKLEQPYVESPSSRSVYGQEVHPSCNSVTVGNETFTIPGPVARACYPLTRRGGNHYSFEASPNTPSPSYYVDELAGKMATINMVAEAAGNIVVPHQFQVNAAKPRTSASLAAQTNQTVHLNLPSGKSSCLFCNSTHAPLDCRAFELGTQYVAFLKANYRCYNCFEQGHTLEYCPVNSTCKAKDCKLTIKHSHFFCGHFKTQQRAAYAGLRAYSLDSSGRFEDVRMHTVMMLLENPLTGREILARGYLDSGCTDTFVKDKVAQGAGLPGLDRRVSFLLSSFSKVKEENEGALVTAVFKSLDGKYRSPEVILITKDELIDDVDSFKMSQKQIDNLQEGGYELADVAATRPGRLPVDIVIGMDLYYQFIRGAPVHCSEGLVLVDTPFGYTLGGPVKAETGEPVKAETTGRRLQVNYAKCKLLGGPGKPMVLQDDLQTNHLRSVLPKRCIPEQDTSLSKEIFIKACLFCGGDHLSEVCTLVNDPDQVLQILKSQSRCFNCFNTDHIVYFCPKKSTCQRLDCNHRGKHLPVVCSKLSQESAASDSINHAANAFRLTLNEEQTSLKQLAGVEIMGINEEDKEESPIVEKFKEEVRKDKETKRVVIKLPWRRKRKERLISNFAHSFERTNKLYDKMSKPSNKEMFEKYVNIMEEQAKMGIIEKVAEIGTVSEVREKLKTDPRYYDHLLPCHEESQICYIPHSGVFKPSTGKLRVVYDASAKPFKGAFSLNDCLETGHSMSYSIADIQTRHRLGEYGYIGDISSAFLTIVVDPCDRDSLRLLWREGEQVIIYRFTRLPFGLTCSPFILNATIKYLLETSTLSPAEVQEIIQSFYVDDLVGSKDTEELVLQEKAKVERTLGEEGSMEMHKWNSNSTTLKSLFIEEGEAVPEVETVLGMVWNTATDQLYVNNERLLKKLGNRNTKEELYSVIAQVFDPMGLISPYVLVAKHLLQKACLTKMDWKDKLPSGLAKEWENWKSELPSLSEVKYDRWVSFKGAEEFELHGFCDASGVGLAASVYLVSKGQGKTQSRLLRCKTRVNSNKPMCMPRRELCATVLLSLVMHVVKDAVKDLNIVKTMCYTDSMNALHWLLSDHYDWPPFISNRIKQVRALTDSKQWRYVNTVQNPADLPSRGSTIEELKTHTLFREGPKFLVTGEPPFLGKMDISAMPEGCRRELPKVALAAQVQEVEPKVNLKALFSTSATNSYYGLMRRTKLVYMFVAKLRARVQGVPADPQSWGMRKLEMDWLRTIQSENFYKEIVYCKDDKATKGECKPQLVHSLSLFWDSESQLLRCSTRLQEANIGYSTANPILVPRDDMFTTMLITAIHERVGHVGVRQTLSALRAEFWVPKARRLVKTIVNRCFKCRLATASPFDLPPPPPLPKCRVTMSRPFSNLGVDFCGPFKLKRNKKWYVAVFTCAVTRAVHFEALDDLSADSFLLAFKRLIGRRGVPELIISDNAKTFKSVARKLRRLFDNPVLQRYFTERRVRWHFYVERAPWHGGFIETCVKLFKGVFKKVVGHSKLNPEEFRTLVVEAEQVVNSRPLTYLYEDQKEGEPLTPSKLLHGYNLTDLPPIGRNGIQERFNLTTRARLLERLQNQFWEQWSESYLHELAERHFSQRSGKEDVREPREGEVVLLRGEPRMPRNRWKLGVIDKVHKSVKGNRIRSVVVRVPEGRGHVGGEYRRSPKHVVPLEAEYD